MVNEQRTKRLISHSKRRGLTKLQKGIPKRVEVMRDGRRDLLNSKRRTSSEFLLEVTPAPRQMMAIQLGSSRNSQSLVERVSEDGKALAKHRVTA